MDKIKYSIVAVIILSFFACGNYNPNNKVPITNAKISDSIEAKRIKDSIQAKIAINLKIGTFNIQNFGKTKLSKTAIVDTLAAIVRMFDVIAIQEISDASNQVASSFLSIVNKKGSYHYKYSCSDRTGLQVNDKSSQEQYAFYYNADVLKLSEASLYDDSKNDLFQREPYIALFSTLKGGFSFILCTVHTAPELAVKEISSLYQVADWIQLRFNQPKNIIFCGDFNASCDYASPEQLSILSIHKPPYKWVIPDSAKTNLSKNSHCAYDRFVVTDALFTSIVSWSVVHYFTSKTVSDHWPVYIEIRTKY